MSSSNRGNFKKCYYCALRTVGSHDGRVNTLEEIMLTKWIPRCYWLVALVIAMVVPVGSAEAPASDLNPAAIAYKLPNQIKWTDEPNGAKIAVLLGDPSKPGLYIVLVKWTPHRMSHPHFHPNDRYITVVSGTWWVGTGTKFDPESTVPLPAGSYVTHFGKQVHYDGAKDAEAVLEIVGEGPATATPAEAK
jgi:hypothetical protein